MEVLQKDKMLDFNSDTFEFVRKSYELDKPGRLDESIDLLKDWVQKQKHFVKKDFSRDYLERMLIAAKGSVERTKERLDRCCTLKTLTPHYFEEFNAKDFIYHGKASIAVLPKLTKNHERVFLCGNFTGTGFSQKLFLDIHRYCIMLMEYIRAHDYVNGYHIIIDYRSPNFMEMVSNFSLLAMRQLATVLIEGYGVRIKGIHLMTDSNFVDILMTLAKQIVPKKISDRIHTHKNLNTVHELIDKDVLPIEFGGKEKSLQILNDEWLETISSKKFREYWNQMIQAKTDESQRQSEVFHEQYMGMPGSFRALSVD